MNMNQAKNRIEYLNVQNKCKLNTFSCNVDLSFYLGDIALLQNMPYRPEMMEFVDGRGDSPFHALFKMSHCPQGKLLASIVRLLLQKGVSPTARDRSQRLPIDYVNRSNNKEVHDILKKYTQRKFIQYMCFVQMIFNCYFCYPSCLSEKVCVTHPVKLKTTK